MTTLRDVIDVAAAVDRAVNVVGLRENIESGPVEAGSSAATLTAMTSEAPMSRVTSAGMLFRAPPSTSSQFS